MRTDSSGFNNRSSRLSLKNFIAPVFALLALGLFSCASDRGSMREPTGVTVSDDVASSNLSQIKSLAVIDFVEGHRPNAPRAIYSCDITGFDFVHGKVSAGSGELVADQFRLELAKRGVKVASRESVMSIIKQAGPGLTSEYGVKLGLFAGEKLGVDAVVMGSVMRFEELVGAKLSADKPASVSFSFAVIDIHAEKIVWKSKFEKTQTPLFSNILDYKTFFKGGMTWQKAHKLSSIGVKNILRKINIGDQKQ
ncbi:hypothetical protein MNBD_NITROSPINAE03-264 [hydrothermal vent metagenome]|uniref:Uncharacterized protein n=1 Tax=hydrothermal vent metagenome TaxID=652676 RepID=A0A3B1C858_9ZZZZ